METIHQELSLSWSGVNQRQKLRTLSRLVPKNASSCWREGIPSEQSTGCARFSFLHPGVVLYCTLFLLTHNTKHILHFKSPEVIGIYVLVPPTWEQTALELPFTQALSLKVFPPLACIAQLLLLSHTNLFITFVSLLPQQTHEVLLLWLHPHSSS